MTAGNDLCLPHGWGRLLCSLPTMPWLRQLGSTLCALIASAGCFFMGGPGADSSAVTQTNADGYTSYTPGGWCSGHERRRRHVYSQLSR